MYYFFLLLGGFGFFFFGISVLSEGLSGRFHLALPSRAPLRGIGAGILWSFAVQSSSAVPASLTAMAEAGLVTAEQTLFVLCGANIGTTLTVWLLTLSVELSMELPAFAAMFFGAIVYGKHKHAGRILCGLAMVLLGVEFFKQAAEPLRSLPLSLETPLMGLLTGTLFTAVIQSSSATLLILQTMGSLQLTQAIPIILGANIGTCATGLLACIGRSQKAKQAALLQLFINLIGTAVYFPLFLLFFSRFEVAATGPRIALCHTVFNVLTVAVAAPVLLHNLETKGSRILQES